MQTFKPDPYVYTISDYFFRQIGELSVRGDAGPPEPASSSEDVPVLTADAAAPSTPSSSASVDEAVLWEQFTPEPYKAVLYNFVQSEQNRLQQLDAELTRAWTRVEDIVALNKQRAALLHTDIHDEYTHLREELAKRTFWSADRIASRWKMPFVTSCENASWPTESNKQQQQQYAYEATHRDSAHRHTGHTRAFNEGNECGSMCANRFVHKGTSNDLNAVRATSVCSTDTPISISHTTIDTPDTTASKTHLAHAAWTTHPHWLRRLFSPFLHVREEEAALSVAYISLHKDIQAIQRDTLAALEERLPCLLTGSSAVMQDGVAEPEAVCDANHAVTSAVCDCVHLPVYRPFEMIAHLVEHLARRDIPSRSLVTAATSSALATTHIDRKHERLLFDASAPERFSSDMHKEKKVDSAGATQSCETADLSVMCAVNIQPTKEEEACLALHHERIQYILRAAAAAEPAGCAELARSPHLSSPNSTNNVTDSLTDCTTDTTRGSNYLCRDDQTQVKPIQGIDSANSNSKDHSHRWLMQSKKDRTKQLSYPSAAPMHASTLSSDAHAALTSQRMWSLLDRELAAHRRTLRAGLQRQQRIQHADADTLEQLTHRVHNASTHAIHAARTMQQHMETAYKEAVCAEQLWAERWQLSESAHARDSCALRRDMAECAGRLQASAAAQERLTRQLRQTWRALCAEQQHYRRCGAQMLRHRLALAQLERSWAELSASWLRPMRDMWQRRAHTTQRWCGWLTEAQHGLTAVRAACVRHVDGLARESRCVAWGMAGALQTQARRWWRCLEDVRVLYAARDADVRQDVGQESEDEDEDHVTKKVCDEALRCERNETIMGCARGNGEGEPNAKSVCSKKLTKEGVSARHMDFISSATRQRVTAQLCTLREATLDFEAHYAEVKAVFAALDMPCGIPSLDGEDENETAARAAAADTAVSVSEQRACMRRIDANWRRNCGRHMCARYRTSTPILVHRVSDEAAGADAMRGGGVKSKGCSWACPAGAGAAAAVHLVTQR